MAHQTSHPAPPEPPNYLIREEFFRSSRSQSRPGRRVSPPPSPSNRRYSLSCSRRGPNLPLGRQGLKHQQPMPRGESRGRQANARHTMHKSDQGIRSRSVRRSTEKASSSSADEGTGGGFGWDDALELTLLGAVALFSIDREMEHQATLRADKEVTAADEMKRKRNIGGTSIRSKERSIRAEDAKGGLWNGLKDGIGSIVFSTRGSGGGRRSSISNKFTDRRRRRDAGAGGERRGRDLRTKSVDANSDRRASERTGDWAYTQARRGESLYKRRDGRGRDMDASSNRHGYDYGHGDYEYYSDCDESKEIDRRDRSRSRGKARTRASSRVRVSSPNTRSWDTEDNTNMTWNDRRKRG